MEKRNGKPNFVGIEFQLLVRFVTEQTSVCLDLIIGQVSISGSRIPLL